MLEDERLRGKKSCLQEVYIQLVKEQTNEHHRVCKTAQCSMENKAGVGHMRRAVTTDRGPREGGKTAFGLGFLKARATTSFTQTTH